MTKATLVESGSNENAEFFTYLLDPPKDGIKLVQVTVETVEVGALAKLTGEKDHKETTIRTVASNTVLFTGENVSIDAAFSAIGYEVKK